MLFFSLRFMLELQHLSENKKNNSCFVPYVLLVPKENLRKKLESRACYCYNSNGRTSTAD